MKYTLLFVFLIMNFCLFSQNESVEVAVELESSKNNEIRILNTFPDSFPTLSVVFKAERNGNPVWDLSMDEMVVYEGSEKCEIISLTSISKQKPINISLVLDHSGSMGMDFSQLYVGGVAQLSIGPNGALIYPEDYLAPIDNARAAIKKFIAKFDLKKDYLSLIGFSTAIDVVIPLTQDTFKIRSVLDTIKATYSTALYDAAFEGIEQLKNTEGVSIEVLLTDGLDNASEKKWQEVVETAQENEIPVFIVGLGDVNVDTLSLIAEQTNGEFFYAKDGSSLDSIYTQISKKILAFYDLRYESVNFSSIDETRNLQLLFNVSDDLVIADSTKVNLPLEVVTYLEQKEKERKYLIYGGVLLVVLLASGLLLFKFRKEDKKENRDEILIRNAFPNPSQGLVTIEHNAKTGFLIARNLDGQELLRQPISALKEVVDLTGKTGMVLLLIESDGQISNTVKVIVQ